MIKIKLNNKFFVKLVYDWFLIGIGIVIMSIIAQYDYMHLSNNWAYSGVVTSFGMIGLIAGIGTYILSKIEKKDTASGVKN